MKDVQAAELRVEQAVARLFVAFFKLRQLEAYQSEYDSKGAVMNMLMDDRTHLRKTYKIIP